MTSKSTFKGLMQTGETYGFTKGKAYKFVQAGSEVLIIDDNNYGVKFSIEQAIENFDMD